MGAALTVLPFKFKHYSLLTEMLEAQSCPWLSGVSYQTLPKIGYIVLLGKQPLAAGFLRRVEGGYGYIDTVVTNPHFGSQMRHQALEIIVKKLLEEAKDLRLRGLIGSTNDAGVLKRAKDLGFTEIDHRVLIKVDRP